MIKALLIGYDTCEYGHITQEKIFKSLEDAKKFCEDNSFIGGYDWNIKTYAEIKEDIQK